MGRKEDNDANATFNELLEVVAELHQVLFNPKTPQPLLARTRFPSGQKIHTKGEYGEMEGTPPPHYSDPTGDDAVSDDKSDRVAITILGMVQTLREVVSRGRWVLAQSDTDVVKRAERSIPDCMACGEPCVGRVLAGLDEKCYRRWLRSGRPDRAKFIYQAQRSKGEKEDKASSG